MTKRINIYTCLKFFLIFSHLCGSFTIIINKNEELKIFKKIVIYQVLLFVFLLIFFFEYYLSHFTVVYLENYPEIFGLTTFSIFCFSVLFSQIRNRNKYLEIFKKLQIFNDQLKVNLWAIRKTCWLIIFVKIPTQVMLTLTFIYFSERIIDEIIFFGMELFIISVAMQLCAILHTERLLIKEINERVGKMITLKMLRAYLKIHLQLLDVSRKTNDLYYQFIFRNMSIFSSMVYLSFKTVIDIERGKIDIIWNTELILWLFSDIFVLVLIIINYDRLKYEVSIFSRNNFNTLF